MVRSSRSRLGQHAAKGFQSSARTWGRAKATDEKMKRARSFRGRGTGV